MFTIRQEEHRACVVYISVSAHTNHPLFALFSLTELYYSICHFVGCFHSTGSFLVVVLRGCTLPAPTLGYVSLQIRSTAPCKLSLMAEPAKGNQYGEGPNPPASFFFKEISRAMVSETLGSQRLIPGKFRARIEATIGDDPSEVFSVTSSLWRMQLK